MREVPTPEISLSNISLENVQLANNIYVNKTRLQLLKPLYSWFGTTTVGQYVAAANKESFAIRLANIWNG